VPSWSASAYRGRLCVTSWMQHSPTVQKESE
jgi:hypothetical protein